MRQILQPRVARKTSLTCAVRTEPAAYCAAIKVINCTGDIFDLSLFNSLPKLLRVVAYFKRFMQRICIPDIKGSSGIVSSCEMTEAMMIFLRQEQKVFFNEIKTLETIPQVKSTSKIL